MPPDDEGGGRVGRSRDTHRDSPAVDERLRAEIAWVAWPPWGDRQSELFDDIYSTHADVVRRAYRATDSHVYMIWDGRRWLRPCGGQWVRVP